MADTPIRVLFLCTGNSARSILAEALTNYLGEGRWRAASAGSHPTGRVNPNALEALRRHGVPAFGFASKSWDEFSGAGAPGFDVVITVCDNAAGESCPVWSGSPVVAHWGIADPASVDGDAAEVRAAFDRAYAELRRRIEALVALPAGELDADALRKALDSIHETVRD